MKTEDRRQKTEDRRQKTEDRRQTVFYLKIDKSRAYLSSRETLMYLWHWVKIAEAKGDDYFILVDDDQVRRNIVSLFLDKGYPAPCNFLASYHKELHELCDEFMLRMPNAAYAHLTPYIHSVNHGYDGFWAIDSDDMMLCASPEICAKLLSSAEQYAKANKIDGLSLDIWYSFALCDAGVRGWSFGVVYSILQKENYMNMFFDGKRSLIQSGWLHPSLINADRFFMFLMIQGLLDLRTFYCENLLLVHHDWYLKKWKNNIEKYYWDFKGRNNIPIGDDVIKIDCGLTENESSVKICQNIMGYSEPCMIYNAAVKRMTGFDIEYLKNRKCNFVLFSAGDGGRRILASLRAVNIDVDFFCDNNPRLWGTEICGVKVISPQELRDINAAIVIYYDEIKEQLEGLGIPAANIHKGNPAAVIFSEFYGDPMK